LEIEPPTKEIISYLKWASYIAIDLYSMQKDNFPYEEADAWLKKAEAALQSDESQRMMEKPMTHAEAAEKLALEYVEITGRLAAVVEWCVNNSGETLDDNPRQLAYAKSALSDARRMRDD
jgi:hypothetical protein